MRILLNPKKTFKEIIMIQKKHTAYDEVHSEVEHDLQEPLDAS